MILSLADTQRLVQSGELTPTAALEECLARLEASAEEGLNAFGELCLARARAEAAAQTLLQERGGSLPPLAGIAIGVKDLEDAAGLVTTFGALPLHELKEPALTDSVQVARLRAAGAIVVGKTNVPVFGSTITTKNMVTGVTRNPHDLRRTPGGSSGGSAAAVAAGVVPFATAADGGGSIRCPAAFTGCFGFKGTRGLVPMTEGVQFGMDRFVHCVSFGPMTRTVTDAAIVLDVVAGSHPQDPMSIPRPLRSFRSAADAGRALSPLDGATSASGAAGTASLGRVVFSPTLGFVSHVDTDIAAGALATATALRTAGFHVHVDGDGQYALPDPEFQWAVAMGAQERAMVAPGLSPEQRGKLDRSMTASWDALEDLTVDQLAETFRYTAQLNSAIEAIFADGFDFIATPCMPVKPFDAAGPIPVQDFAHPMHVVGFLTPFNFSGHPAASVPFSAAGAPAGLQIIARRHDDRSLLHACAALEAVAPFPTAYYTDSPDARAAKL